MAGVSPPWLRNLGGLASSRWRVWSAAEVAPGRLVPWLPVAFGIGVILYFTAAHEPSLWAAIALAAAAAGAAVALRARPFGYPVALAVAAAAAGFATATVKSASVAHPVLHRTVYGAELSGWIEVREERERTDRITIRIHAIEAKRLGVPLERVRLSVRKGTAPPVGTFIALKSRLSPPLEPLRPGGYDFARDLYFQGIGASGFTMGKIAVVKPPSPPSAWLRYATVIASTRDAIDARMRAALAGDVRAIASALITGKRDAISTPVNDAMFISGLGHVLSISGYHMAVVAGVVFFAVRGLLALVPYFALRFPIKKWAALAALMAAALYLLLSGSEVATQRSFVMTAIVLAGVLVDRQALTMRNLALAAFGVLLLAPQSIVHPSFQLSFAATLALLAAYERGLPWTTRGADTSFGARVALWGGRELVSLLVASTVAGLATTLFAAYHFHRLAPYGALANLLAMPVVSAWVMPMGLLALLAMPFGFDGFLWSLMGIGIEWMVAVALWVAQLPGAVGRIHAFGVAPVLLGAAGLVVVCLLRTPLRWIGAVLAGMAVVIILRTPQPDIYVSPDAGVLAVRGESGRLRVVKLGIDTFAAREWLAADADARTPSDASLRDGVRCDAEACLVPLQGGGRVSAVLEPEAFAEDCRNAVLVVTRRQAPPDCAAMIVDRKVSQRFGALALYRRGDGFAVEAARPDGEVRPWMPAGGADRPSPARRRARAQDSTPHEDDLRADD
ncbi:MAG: ComEC/Rec2 family competence protein [Variibacter sp.]